MGVRCHRCLQSTAVAWERQERERERGACTFNEAVLKPLPDQHRRATHAHTCPHDVLAPVTRLHVTQRCDGHEAGAVASVFSPTAVERVALGTASRANTTFVTHNQNSSKRTLSFNTPVPCLRSASQLPLYFPSANFSVPLPSRLPPRNSPK